MHLLKSQKLTTVYLALGLIFAILIVFAPTLNFSFLNFDDNVFVINNPNVNSGLSWKNFIWSLSNSYAGQWQPITWLSHMLDVELYGLDAGKHHLFNILIHSLSSVGILFILLSLRIRPGIALLFAAFWGLHPMRLESVAWVAERKDVLSVFFAILALLAYINYEKSSNKVLRYCLTLSLFILALMSKPITITLPLLFLLLDYSIVKREKSFSYLLIEKLPFFTFSIISSVITFLAQAKDKSLSSIDMIPISDRISMATTSYLAYLAKFVWPSGGGIFYPAEDFPPGIGSGACLAIIILIFISLKYYIKQEKLFFSLFWLLISLLPVIGFVHVGGQALADRWTYFSHIGLIIGLALFVNELTPYKKISITTFSLLLLIFTYISHTRLPNWKDSKSIFSYTLEVSPNNFMAHTNLGVVYDQEGRLDLAKPHFEEAARLNPNYPEALNNLGSLKAREGKLPEAIELFQKALKMRPDLIDAQRNLNLALSMK